DFTHDPVGLVTGRAAPKAQILRGVLRPGGRLCLATDGLARHLMATDLALPREDNALRRTVDALREQIDDDIGLIVIQATPRRWIGWVLSVLAAGVFFYGLWGG
ncbi:MAG: hypothetical protein ACI9MC_003024, partial [Kiritimatiellia bacterium]